MSQSSSQIRFDFSGKHVLVTGGSRGIGAAIVRKFVQAGATVLFNYTKAAQQAQALEKELGGKAIAVQADLADHAAIDTLVEAVDQHLQGRLDVLVNNAGVFVAAPLDQLDVSEFLRQQRVNVEAPILLSKALLGRLQDHGRVINIGSLLGDRAIGQGMSVYASTKAALQLFTRGLSKELGARGITVNIVQPGPVDTEMNPDSADNQMAEGFKAMTSLGRYGKAEEIADTVAFLASDAAAYITGSAITIDGGMNA